MKFDSFDSGNCRAYYRKERKLYCIQDETSWGKPNFQFYACSRDGEPAWEVKHDFPSLEGEYAARKAAYYAE